MYGLMLRSHSHSMQHAVATLAALMLQWGMAAYDSKAKALTRLCGYGQALWQMVLSFRWSRRAKAG